MHEEAIAYSKRPETGTETTDKDKSVER